MRIRDLVIFVLSLSITNTCLADEGMWLLNKIKYQTIDTMHSLGLEITAEDIYSDDGESLKDAIVILGKGCTGELISDQGLLITNHHCGYGQIQYHSSVKHDYINNGFWAMSKEEELPNPDFTVSFLIDLIDITDSINGVVSDDMNTFARMSAMDEVFSRIEKSVSDTSHYKGQVKSYYGGNVYYLLIYEVFPDVRLVGAPPFSIGKYGADSDNWTWPRHTGDFCLFRVYTGPDGKPAKYSGENIPYKPKRFLPISLQGYKKNDFTMILGYPARTQRFNTSSEINLLKTTTLPLSVDIRETRQQIMFRDMQNDEKVNIQYSEKYYMGSTNYWKFYTGQLKGIDKLNIVERKQAQEKEFMTWVEKTQPESTPYKTAIYKMDSLTNELKDIDYTIRYFSQGIYSGIEFVGFSNQMVSKIQHLSFLEKDSEKYTTFKQALIDEINLFFKNYNPPTDEKMAMALLSKFKSNVDPEYHPEFYNTIDKKYKGNIEKFVATIFKKSVFVNQEKLLAEIQEPDIDKLKKDPGYRLSKQIKKGYLEINTVYYNYKRKISDYSRMYIKGLLEMDSTRFGYPDANSTMRLTYGTVQDIYPRDAVHYDYRTTLKGVMEKKDQQNWEFKVPKKLIDLYDKRDYGKYGVNDTLYTCFITNNDITGGNSGSPVLNGKGELIGLAFDGNWEAMTGDIIFEPDLQRCINVDIRYVLFIIDKFAGASHLLEEMDIRY